MTVLVVDASIAVALLADDGAVGTTLRHRVEGEALVAPALLDAEVLSALRGLERAGKLTGRRAGEAVLDLLELALRRVPHQPLLQRAWELRGNLTAYDAIYVALAEIVGATLLTADRRLAGAPGIRCAVEVLP